MPNFQQIPQGDGTAIGDMISYGGLAAAFDSNTNQVYTSCARNSANSGWLGKTLPYPMKFGQAIIFGSNNDGYSESFGDTPITINIRAKNGSAPVSRTDGTIVGTLSFTDTTNESTGRTIASSDLTTNYDHYFAEISEPNGDGSGVLIGELQLFQHIASSMMGIFDY